MNQEGREHRDVGREDLKGKGSMGEAVRRWGDDPNGAGRRQAEESKECKAQMGT